jgi:DNA-binding CsgD family transcriptional regulator
MTGVVSFDAAAEEYDAARALIVSASTATDGVSAGVIAVSRGVSVGTVRFQIKAILAKLGVRRQVEVAALVNRL